MLRIVAYLIVMIFLITIVRGVVGFIMKAFADFVQKPAAAASKPTSEVPLTGELKRDPVCGTYTSAATSLQQTVGHETFYFCSPQCRDKFQATAG